MFEPPAVGDERDRALVRQCLAGDRAAAGELVDRHERRLFNVALRMLGNVEDAEDVTQTVFGNAFLALQSYDPKYRFLSWVYRMTINESLNALKRRKPMVTLDDELGVPAPGFSPDGARDADERVRRALLELTPDDRAIVVLRHFASFSYEEIGKVLEVPAQTIKSRLFTARQRLRDALLRQAPAAEGRTLAR